MNASIWKGWKGQQTWSPSCEARTSAGPHNWPSCAHCKASFFLPETRRFCTSEAVAYKIHHLLQNNETGKGKKKVGRKAEQFITYPYLSFRRQILQAVAKSTILTELCAVPLSRCKKFSNCWFWRITILFRIQRQKITKCHIYDTPKFFIKYTIRKKKSENPLRKIWPGRQSQLKRIFKIARKSS